MKKILLSFNPLYYEPVANGEKKFEYRSRFSSEAVEAYLYLSSPIQKIVSIVEFGKRIDLEDMKKSYVYDTQAINRIQEYIDKYNKRYAVPIKKVTFIEPISLDEIRKRIPGFMPPQSYLIIKEGTILNEFLSNCRMTGKEIILDHSNINSNEICIN